MAASHTEQAPPRAAAIEPLSSRTEVEQFLAAISEGIWKLQLDRDAAFFSDRCYTMLGYEPGAFPATVQRWRALLHPDDAAGVGAAAREHFAHSDAQFDAQLRLRARQGDYHRVCARVRVLERDAQGRLVALLGSFEDISARSRAEAQARSSQERFDALFSSSRELIYLIDFDGRFLDANEAALDVLGFPRKVLEALRLGDVFDPEDKLLLQRRLQEVRRSGSSHAIDLIRVRTRHGGCRWLETTATRLDRDGAPYAVLAIGRDVTEQRALQEQLHQAQKMEALGTLAGGVAHDMNNTLSVVLGLSSLLQAQVADDDPIQGDLADMVAAARRGKALVENLLGFARKATWDVQQVDLNDLVRRVVSVLQRTISRSVALTAALDPDLHPVRCDPSPMEQALINICINAAEAIADAGAVFVSTANVEVSETLAAQLPGLCAGPHVRVCVSDDGGGMDEETCARALEPFFTTKPPGKGTGLGLSMAYGLVRSAAGALTIESQPGEGTKVEIYLPAASAAAAATRHAPPAPRRPAARAAATVLVVDDEPAVRRVGRRLLEQLGLQALTADGGPEALALCARRADEIDLVLLDLSMPGMDGAACFAELRAKHPDLRVLICTGHGKHGAIQKLVADGALGVLRKPFDLRQLSTALDAALDGTRDRRSTG